MVVSPCLCYGLDKLATRLPESSAIYGVELEPSLLSYAQIYFSKLELDPKRFRLGSSTTPEIILTEAAILGNFRRVRELRLSGGRELNPSGYEHLIETITINNRIAWRNRMTLVRLGRLWVKNVITNLATLPWEHVVPEVTATRPIVLCGAGPSLNNALGWIKKHARQLTIIAVDTAAGTLVQAGITPDQLVCLEAQAHNLPDFTPLARLRLNLVADITAHPASFRIMNGPKKLVLSQWMTSRFLDRLLASGLPFTPVPPLGSVGVLAARMAVRQRQVLFVTGLDFSFVQGMTHCIGSPSDLAERLLETRLYKQNKNWDLSYAPGVNPTAKGELSNAILSMYATSAGVELQNASVFDIRAGFGQPLPAPAITFKQADDLLSSLSQETSQNTPADELVSIVAYHQDTRKDQAQAVTGMTMQGAEYRNAAKIFMEKELRLAKNLAGCLRAGDIPLNIESIRDCDYMYAHFPDPERVEALELDALKRLAAEAGYWQTRLQAALFSLSGHHPHFHEAQP